MQITEVRIKLMDDPSDRLRAFCSITFDNCFVVRDLKIIEGASGPFVAMPSRKLTSHCPECGCKNHLRAAHCNQCGARLKEDLAVRDQEGRAKLYADIAHPINSNCREMIQDRVIQEYLAERERAQTPGYVSRYDDYFSDAGEEGTAVEPAVGQSPPTPTPGARDITQVQSPESGIPAPHAVPAAKSDEKRRKLPKSGGFGEGIF